VSPVNLDATFAMNSLARLALRLECTSAVRSALPAQRTANRAKLEINAYNARLDTA